MVIAVGKKRISKGTVKCNCDYEPSGRHTTGVIHCRGMQEQEEHQDCLYVAVSVVWRVSKIGPSEKMCGGVRIRVTVVAVSSSCDGVSEVTSNLLWWIWKNLQKWCQKPPLLAAISQELRQW